MVAADPQAHGDLSAVSVAVAPVVADELGVFDDVHGAAGGALTDRQKGR